MGDILVILGALLRKINLNQDGHSARAFEVAYILRHKDENPSNFSDVAIVGLKRRALISEHIRPACLPNRGCVILL